MFSSNKTFFLVLMATGMIVTGCGRNYSGVYKGQESVNEQSTTSSQAVTAKTYDVQLTLDQQGDQVNGQYTSTSGVTGNFRGTASGQGITNVTMSMNPTTNTYGSGIYPSYYAGSNCAMSYTAPVSSFNNNRLSGTLSIQGALPYGMNCGAGTGNARTFDLGK